MKTDKPKWVTYDKIKGYQWFLIGFISTLAGFGFFLVWYLLTH